MRMHASLEDFVPADPEQVERAAALLRLLADPTRLRILHALRQGESYVGCLAELSGANQPAVSQHLAKLRLAGVIIPRRQGTHTFYALADPQVGAVLDLLLAGAVSSAPAPR